MGNARLGKLMIDVIEGREWHLSIEQKQLASSGRFKTYEIIYWATGQRVPKVLGLVLLPAGTDTTQLTEQLNADLQV
jgi:hypothetical protein